MFKLAKLNFPAIGRNLVVFNSPGSFCSHLYKHLLDGGLEQRAWSLLLPLESDPWRALRRSPLSSDQCQNPATAPVLKMERLQEAYDAVVKLCREGIIFATKVPLYLVVEEEYMKMRSVKSRRETWHFLSRDGANIIARGSFVRTVFLTCKGTADTRHDLFWQGLRNILQRGLAVESRRRTWRQDENAYTTGISCRWFARENFSNRINPWPSPKRQVYKPLSEDRAEYREYLRGLAGAMTTPPRPKRVSLRQKQRNDRRTI